METLLQDIRYGVRVLLKRTGFTGIAILTLALAIGANTSIFSIVSGVLLRPYAHLDTDHWAYIWEKPKIEGLSQISVSLPNYLDWKAQSKSFAGMVSWLDFNYNLSGATNSDPEQIRAAIVTPDLFSAIGLTPAAGRLLVADDSNSDGHRLVISYSLWQRRFGGDPTLPGKKIELNLVPFDVLGIAPSGFSFPAESSVDAWIPMPYSMINSGTRDGRGYRVSALLKPGADFKAAQSELNLITDRLASQYPEDKGYGAIIVPMRESIAGKFRMPLLALLGALGLVLLLACVNIANLQLVRLEARRKELALRTALGAGRWRLIRQLTTESVILVIAAGALGILLAPTGVRILLSFVPPSQSPWLNVTIDRTVLLVSAGITLLTAILAGLLPALKASRFNLTPALAAGGSVTGTGAINRNLRSALLVAQLALALIPLVGTGLLVQTFLRLGHVDPGFKSDHRISLTFTAPRARYGTPEKVQMLAERVAEEVRQIPGVHDAGLGQYLPFAPSVGWLQAISRTDPKGIQNPADLPHVRYMVTSTGYVEAMGIPVKKGRTFAKADSKDAPPVAIINETLAQKYFPGEDPIGKRIWAGHAQLIASLAPRTIVGVVGDYSVNNLEAPPDAAILIPISQQTFSGDIWRNLYLVAHTDIDPLTMINPIRQQIGRIDGQLALTDIATMDNRVGDSLWRQRFMAFVVSGLSVAAVLIAMLGVFGITSYLVSQRTREIGVRIAIGAQSGDIMGMIMKEGLVLVAIGITLGTVGALGLARFISTLLFGVGAADPLTFSGVAALLGGLALLACYIPARRATKVDPMIALRYE